MTKKRVIFGLTALLMLVTACFAFVCCNYNNGDKTLPDVGEMIVDGQTAYKVVIPSNATATQEYSAQQICSYFAQVTGVTMSYVVDGGEAYDGNSTIISLGKTSAYNTAVKNHKKVDVSRETLNDDGFVMFTDGKSLFIDSYNDRGIMYGAFEFIEQNLGVKFLTYDYTYVPTVTQVVLKGYDKTYVSPFRQRVYLNTPIWYKDTDYVAHMRYNTDFCNMPENMGSSTKWSYYGSGGDATHTGFRIVVPSDYMETVDGVTRIKSEYVDCFSHTGSEQNETTYWFDETLGEPHDLCFTSGVNEDGSPDLTKENTTVRLVAESLKRWIVEDADAQFYMVGQADRSFGCPCDRCKAARDKNMDSGLMVRFINAVSQILDEWKQQESIDKDYSLVIFAYSYSEKAPVRDGKAIDSTVVPAENVYVRYAPIRGSYYYSLQDERQTDDVKNIYEDWGKITDRLMIWTYHDIYSNCFWYYPTYQAMSSDMQMLESVGTEYAMAQSTYLENGVYTQHLNAYIHSKLCWNSKADVGAIRDEFLYYYFGETAYEYMREFHVRMDDRYALMAANSGSPMIANLSKNGVNQGGYWTYNFLNDIVDLFGKAIAAVNANEGYTVEQKATYVEHIEKTSLQPLYMRWYNAKANGYTDNEQIALVSEWVALAEKYGVTKYGENIALTIAAIKAQFGLQ